MTIDPKTVKAHPRPWRTNFDEYPHTCDEPILDAAGEPVLITDSGFYPPPPEVSELIVEAVNQYEKAPDGAGAAGRGLPETPRRNCERFGSWEEAYLAWVQETQDTNGIDWDDLGDDDHERAEELWMHYFQDDQNREFCDWLMDKVEPGKEGAK